MDLDIYHPLLTCFIGSGINVPLFLHISFFKTNIEPQVSKDGFLTSQVVEEQIWQQQSKQQQKDLPLKWTLRFGASQVC